MNSDIKLAFVCAVGPAFVCAVGMYFVEINRERPLTRIQYNLQDITGGYIHIICKVRKGETVTNFSQCYIKN